MKAPTRTQMYLWYCCVIAAMCMFLNGYDSSTFNAVQGSEHFMNYFHNPSPEVIGSVNTAYTVGGVVTGFFLSAPVSDRFGRKWTMNIGAVFIIVSTIIASFTPRAIGGFIASRALTGIGQGMAMPAGPVYINEIAPAGHRGMVMSLWQLFFGFGSFLAYWINFACTKKSESLGNWDWKIVMLGQLIAPIIIIAGLFFCPETPRWYIQKDRMEDAARALTRLRDNDDDVQVELQEVQQAIAYEKVHMNGKYSPLWKDKATRYRFRQGSLVMYSTMIYKKVFTDNSQIQLINALNGTFGILFTLNATWMADRFGRRPLLLIGAAGMSVCMFIVAAVVTETPNLADGSKQKSVGIATVFLMFLFAFFYKPSWGATVWIWTSEVFSMNVRAQAVAMSTQSQSISNTILQQIFPIFLDKKGFYAMYMFGAINIVLFIYVWFLIPETNGVSLEHMDHLFGGIDHTDKGAGMLEGKSLNHQHGIQEVETLEDTKGEHK
ncbi:hypothetical protein Neosp_010196 [[Neocosmospora] mangrovei]